MKGRHLVLAPILALAAACSQGDKKGSDTAAVAPESAALPVINLTASDYKFDGPDSATAGPTWIRMTNTGKEFHHVILVRMDGGHTVDELLKAMGSSEIPPEWAKMIGGPIAPSPGATVATQTAVPLQAGTYALICVVPAADNVPHVAKGMVRQLTVTPPATATARAPIVSTTTLTLADYNFTLTTPLVAGKNTIRVVNAGGQPHEVVIIKMFPGKKVEDVLAFSAKPTGPPPGEVVGGASFIVGDVSNFVEVDLAPADYALVCFVPDAKDGKPHVAHGMFQAFKIG